MGARVLLRDLSPGTLYFLQIRGKNGPYVSPWSNIFSLETIHDVVPPLPVEDLVWEPNGTSFTATWTPPEYSEDGTPAYDLAGYEVIVYAPADGAVFGLPAPDPNRRVTFNVNGPRFDFSFEQNVSAFDYPRGKVAIEVRAYDTTGNKSQPTFAVAQNPVPAEVPSFNATGLMDGIAFDWTKVPSPPDDDIKFYRIRQGLASGAINTVIAETNDIHTEWATIFTGVQWFSIVAVDVFYQESATKKTDSAQARSSLEVDVTVPGAPTNVQTSSGVDTADPSNSRVYIDVAWNRPTGLTDTDLQEYIIRYSPNQSNWQYMTVPAEDSAGNAVETARIFNLVAGQSYYVAVKSVDYSANNSVWVNSQSYPQATQKDSTAPSTPAAPTVAVDKGATLIQVTHSLKRADGTTNLETDLDHFEVYASTSTGFTPSSANRVGDLQVVPPPATGAPIPAIDTYTLMPTGGSTTQTWYVKVIAVDNAGNRSLASAQSSGAVELIKTVNIADASITDAKIGTLSANKITAGTGFINDITIKNKFTIGDASTNGIMESFDFVAGGTTGWRIEKGQFTVNAGTINARSLVLQDGENRISPAYADFEFPASFYTTNLLGVNGATWSIDATAGNVKYNSQSLRINSAAATFASVYLAPTDSSYSAFPVDTAEKYIASVYAKTAHPGGATVGITVRWSDGTWVDSPDYIVGNTFTRISGLFTPPAGATGAIWILQVRSLNVSTGVFFDGVQVEKQMAGSSSPSVWQPFSRTYIDGGNIKTGSIQSSQPADSLTGQPAWSINTNGGAQFGSANVRGTLWVGPTGTTEVASSARSGLFAYQTTPGTGTGWIIRGDGYAEFNNVLVRGNIQATSGTFTNNILVGDSASATHNIRSYTYDGANNGWTIRGDGHAIFNSAVVRGTIYAYSGEFGGTLKAGTSIEAGLSITSPLITGGTVRGATLMSLNGVGASMVMTNNPGYGALYIDPGNGVSIPADIRVGENTGIAYYAIQMYSPSYGGNRSHISCVAQTGGNAAEVDLVAPGGPIYMTGGYVNVDTDLYSQGNNYFRMPSTTSSGGQTVVWVSYNGGWITRNVSSRRFKNTIGDPKIDPKALLNVGMKRWKSNFTETDGDGWAYGLIAEDVAEAIPEAGWYDDEGLVENYNDRMVVASLLELVKDLNARVAALEAAK